MNNQKFEAIFFDMDGLLVDTEPYSLKSAQEVFGSVGIEVSEEWYIRENLGKGRNSLELAVEKGIPSDEIEILRRRRNDRYSELLREDVWPMDGVPETLELLQKRNILMAIVTSTRMRNLEIVLDKTGFRKYFTFYVTRDDVTKSKPDPEPYLKAWELSGYPKENCLVLEDSYRGVLAAKAAGLTCFAIPDALTREHNFSIADKVLHSIRELPDLLSVL